MRNILGLITLAATVFLALNLFQQHQDVMEIQRLKQEKAEVLNIKYGLLSLDEWKSKSFAVIENRINEFRLTGNNRRTLRPQINDLLYGLLDEVEAVVRNRSDGPWYERFLREIIQGIVLDFGQLRSQIPQFTERILDELGNNANQYEIKRMIISKVKELLDLNAPRQDQAVRDYFFSTYDCASYEECGEVLNQRIAPLEYATSAMKPLLIGIAAVIAMLYFLFARNNITRFNIFSLVILCSVCLMAGVYYPMLSIDARVLEFNFEILGMDVAFGEQVLFYKSKSVIDIVYLLIEDGKTDTLLVGALILLFSILFPVSKLLLSLFVSQRAASPLTKFLTTKASKWSMADVFVVAIIMGFIGLRGIISNQIGSLESNNPFVDLIATDYTSLNIGFTLFLLFCLLSLVLGNSVHHFVNNED
jgi:hypothetical protein